MYGYQVYTYSPKKKNPSDTIFHIHIWYTPLFEVVVIDQDLKYEITQLGIGNPNLDADYIQDYDFAETFLYIGKSGKELLNSLDQIGVKYSITLRENKHRFGEEAWMKTNGINKNIHKV